MEAFWYRGYEATSMNELVEVMGIHRGSLYSTFGDKQTLFQSAIAHYKKTVVHPTVSCLAHPTSPKQGIIDFFNKVAQQAATDPLRRGCFFTNTVVEFGEHHPDLSPHLAEGLEQFESMLYRSVVQAQTRQEIPADKDARAIAQFLLTTLHGMRVISKINPSHERLTAVVDVALSVLD